MTKEELKQQFLELGKEYGFEENEFEQFLRQLVIPSNCIKNIEDMEQYDEETLIRRYRVWVNTTKASMVYYFDIVCAEKVGFNNIILNAIKSYNNWCCEPQYEEYGILRYEEVTNLYVVDVDGREFDIFRTLEGMRKTIISRMEESSTFWTSDNVSIFKYYIETLMPILEALDYVDKHTDVMELLG